MITVIALSGKARTGKDFLANYLVKKYDFVNLSFASPVKRMAAEYFFWDGKKDKEGRQLLQWLGTTHRDYDPEIWIKHADKEIRRLIREHDKTNFVFSDTRFPNEVRWAQRAWDCGAGIRVTRPGVGPLPGAAGKHVSETALDDFNEFDYHIVNDDAERVYKELDKIYEEIRASV